MGEEKREDSSFSSIKKRADINTMNDMLQDHVGEMGASSSSSTKVIQPKWAIDPSKLSMDKKAFASGAFASVHKGVYKDREVAVRVLEWGQEEKRGLLQRDFQREISVWFDLEHPNITKCVGATTLGDSAAWVISEYVPNGTLGSYLRKIRKSKPKMFRQPKLPSNVALQLGLDIAKGLRYLHSKNIVHRDLKTENLLVDANGTIKIADFGVSRLEATVLNEMTGYTGTSVYMAPEVIQSKPYDKKCDVYSFAICLWEICSCQIPYNNYSSEAEVTFDVVNKHVRPHVPRGCESSLAKIIRRCWDHDPKRRPDMEEVVRLLEGIKNSKDHHHPHHGWLCGFSLPETK